MSRTECGRSRCRAGVAVGKLALIVLAVLTATSSAPASEQEMNQEGSQIYQHTYDEVFQASKKAVERKGWFVTASDKDKGTITGTMGNTKNSFNIHVEALNTKPETRVTLQIKWYYKKQWLVSKQMEQDGRNWVNSFLSELQKVLSTYD
ncbi:MAG: hypothetical protein ACLPLR_05990 [Terriglobales bacterium]